jgi:hypothetical protein
MIEEINVVAVGNRIDGWRECWIGDWDTRRVLFVVMVEKAKALGSHGERAALPTLDATLKELLSYYVWPASRSSSSIS